MPLQIRQARLRRLIREGVLAALLILIGLAAFIGNLVQQAEQDRLIRRHTHLILISERLLSELKDLETGQRGFILTGNQDFLQPFIAAQTSLDSDLAELGRIKLPTDDLPAKVAKRRALLETGIRIRREAGLETAINSIQQGSGRQTMDDCRQTVARLQAGSQAAIGKIAQQRRRWTLGLDTLCLGSVLIAFAIIGLLAWTRRRETQAGAKLLEAVMENAPVGLGLLDSELRVQHMNRALSTMADRALSVEVGTSLWDVMPQLRGSLEAGLRQVVSGGRAVPNIEVTAASAARPDQQRDFLVSVYPLRTAGGNGAGMVVTDVTTRNRVERKMREGEERFRILTEASASIIWAATPDGTLTETPMWCAFTGQSPEVVADKGWLDAVHPDDQAETAAAWQMAITNRTHYLVQHRLRRADGEWRHMDVRAVPVIQQDGRLREWVGTHTDVTERRRAEEALAAARDAAEAANRAKSTFLANMSHELRTPLSAVIGYAEMLEEEIEEMDEPHLLRDLKKIETNARHLLSLINDVLDLSKIEANRMTTYAEDFEVAALVREAAGTVDALVKKNDNALQLDLADDLGAMHSDVVKIRQCLFNLVSNAAKFTENGVITVRVRRLAQGERTGWLQFAVADTGIGMNAEQLNRLFQRFAQADDSTTRQFGGTGLGLAITRAFCRLLGGTIEVASTAGQGTTFTIELPPVLPERLGEAATESGDLVNTDGRELVLVIDDDESQRDLLSRFLNREGFAVRCASDGATGLELARTLQPRAILLDVMMPQMDGWSVLTALKADPLLAAIPVVMASFVNEPALGRSLGAVDYILKPVEWTQLKSVMDRFRQAEGDVLVVDDDPGTRERMRSMLEKVHWTVIEAANGREALDRVAHAIPQLILLDLTMPVMDGFEFLHELRLRPGCDAIPVVVLSAKDLSADERDQLQSASQILRKDNVNLRELASGLREMLAPE